MRLRLVSLTLSIMTAAGAAVPVATAAAPVPPETRRDGTVDTYFGRKVPDPYRWMEKRSPEMLAWAKSQDAFARATLDGVPGRDRLRATMDGVTKTLSRAGDVALVPGKIFFVRHDAGTELGVLVMRDVVSGTDTVLFDPNTLRENGQHVSLDQFAPSEDGGLVAIAYAPGGSEEPILRVIETASGKLLPDAIDRAKFFSVSFSPDGKGFFYNRLHAPKAGEKPAARYDDNRVFYHKLGGDPEKDRFVFGAGLGALSREPRSWYFGVSVLTGTHYALGIENDGTSPEDTLWLATLPARGGEPMRWRKVASTTDGVVEVQADTHMLFLRTHKGASRYRIMALPLDGGTFATAREIVAEQPGVVLTNIAAARDGLYVAGRRGSGSVLWRMPSGGAMADIAMPMAGTVAAAEGGGGALVAHPLLPGAVAGIEGWVSAQAWFSVASDGGFKPLALNPPTDLSATYTVTETSYRARDGVDVPLSIVERNGTARDGKRPVLLEAYGSYGISETPWVGLIPVVAAWTEAGGVFAVAHVRGGGDLGDAWHRAGQKATKQNTIHDDIDAARALIAMGYATPSTMAITGTSAGGITVGGALTQEPGLFRAVISRVGVSDSLRTEQTENGPSNVPEFGTVTKREEFGPLYDMDAYQHVRSGVDYPAVLLTAGANDHRVEWWEPAKMAAALQASGSARPVLLRIEYEGGHGGIGAGQSQSNAEWADSLAFALLQMEAEGFR